MTNYVCIVIYVFQRDISLTTLIISVKRKFSQIYIESINRQVAEAGLVMYSIFILFHFFCFRPHTKLPTQEKLLMLEKSLGGYLCEQIPQTPLTLHPFSHVVSNLIEEEKTPPKLQFTNEK